MWLLVCKKAVMSILVKLETSHTVILPPTSSVLYLGSTYVVQWYLRA